MRNIKQLTADSTVSNQRRQDSIKPHKPRWIQTSSYV